MQKRKEPLENGFYYHIYSRSIAGYNIFNDTADFDRFYHLLKLYRYSNFDYKYSRFIDLNVSLQASIILSLEADSELLVDIVSFCLMPTHLHLLLKQNQDNGISKFMARVLNGYSRYFNTKHKRSGPLWSGRFKSVLVRDDDQLLHLTRYIHLNPTSAGLVNRLKEWRYSSYGEYVNEITCTGTIICKDGLFDWNPKSYKKFVLDRKSYQRDLSLIKSLIIDDYTG